VKLFNRGRGRRRGRLRSFVGLTCAVICTLLLAFVSVAGAGTLPPLGAALNPGTGVWPSAGAGKLPTDRTVALPGMDGKATVGFESNGIAHITAGSDSDMFRAMGYTHAKFRLFQMDLARRQAEGRLAEAVGGKAAFDSDVYELDIGLIRAAERDWRQLPAGSPAKAALTAYAAGVNAGIEEMKRANTLPVYYRILNFGPEPWTPVDSLAVQRLETQTLALDVLPTAYSYIARGLGTKLFEQMYQASPQNTQYPYDPGPYQKLPLAPLPPRDDGAPTPVGSPGTGPSTVHRFTGDSAAATDAAGQILDRVSKLPANAVHTIGNSNAWVVSGKLTASGKPIMASDPHLNLTVPAIWYQLEVRSPSYHLAGVSVPGIPAVLIGKNDKMSWSITNSQRPGTLFYLEKTDAAHPDQYFWNGAWRPMSIINYKIKTKHGTENHTVRMTVHGPIMTIQGVTASMWYPGTLPSDNLDSILQVGRAQRFSEFHEALRGWGTPAQNFAYADNAGDIGIVNAGFQPEVRSGKPWLPLSGTGESDVAGTVPFDALPITHNPPSGFAATSNQREVGPDYPYYYGRGYDFFDQGWRQAELVRALSGRTGITAAQMQQLQMDDVDDLARVMVPSLLQALNGQQLDPVAAKARGLLTGWDYRLGGDSAAATVWLRFLLLYDYAVWHPVWEQNHVPAPPRDVFTPRLSDGTYAVDALHGMLANLTVKDPTNPLFTPAGVPKRTAVDLMRTSFTDAVQALKGQRGADVSTWHFGDRHYVLIASLLQQTVLDRGPYHYGGNGRVINTIVSVAPVRDGKTLTGVAAGGASWRFVVDWGAGTAVSSMPGGQSENPASPWYANLLPDWLAGRTSPVLEGDQADATTKGRTWTLTR
jgi:penicillin amidase